MKEKKEREQSQKAPLQRTEKAHVEQADIQQAIANPQAAGEPEILRLQEEAGNTAVAELLASTQPKSKTNSGLLPPPDMGKALIGGIISIQANLKVGPVGDSYEQEADQVAEQVVSMSTSENKLTSTDASSVQRQQQYEQERQEKPLAANITPLVQRQPEEKLVQRQPEEEEELLQMKTKSAFTPQLVQRQDGVKGFDASEDFENSLSKTKGSGSPLSPAIRTELEPKFGADFSGVRVHTGSQSDKLNQSIQARAFTTGQDIFIGSGNYDPGSKKGKKLLAHELTHVVQQTGTGTAQAGINKPGQAQTKGVIQRLTGLPTKQDAITWGGEGKESFLGAIGHLRLKTTWGKIVKSLEEFGDMKLGRYEVKLAKLIEIRELCKAWLSSGNRNYPADEKKRTFIMNLLGNTTKLYSETKLASLGMESPAEKYSKGAASEDVQQALTQKIEAELALADLDAAIGKIEEMETILRSAPLTLNFKPPTLQFWMDDPMIKSGWETGRNDPEKISKKDSYEETREIVETELGYPPFEAQQKNIRPISAGINITRSKKGAAPLYGKWFVQLKESVKKRAVYIPVDAFMLKDRAVNVESKIKDVPLKELLSGNENLANIMAYNSKLLQYLAILVLQGEDAASKVKKPGYPEANIQGQVSMADVEALYVHAKATEDQMKLANKFSQKYGIPVKTQ